MTPIDAENMQEKKVPRSPRIFTNTSENLLRSIERLARWTLKADVTPGQIQKVRATTGLLRLRVELARLSFERERWVKEMEIEVRLQQIEEQLKGNHGHT